MGANAQLLDTCLANKNIIGANNIFCLRLRVAERAEGARGGAPAAAGGHASARHLPGEKKYYWSQ
jgi:hypothetical protein